MVCMRWNTFKSIVHIIPYTLANEYIMKTNILIYFYHCHTIQIPKQNVTTNQIKTVTFPQLNNVMGTFPIKIISNTTDVQIIHSMQCAQTEVQRMGILGVFQKKQNVCPIFFYFFGDDVLQFTQQNTTIEFNFYRRNLALENSDLVFHFTIYDSSLIWHMTVFFPFCNFLCNFQFVLAN